MTHAEKQVRAIYTTFKTMKACLPDGMVDEWCEDLNREYRDFLKKLGPEPDWHSYGLAANEICREDGMPLLYVVEES